MRGRFMVAGLVVAGATLFAPPASADGGHGTRRMTATQTDNVYKALVEQGYTANDAMTIASNPQQARFVPVSTSFEETRGAGRNSAAGGMIGQALGDCSGSGKWIERTQYINNQFGEHIAHIKLRTNWSYNGSRVTCAGSSWSWYIYGWVPPTLVQWKGWQDYTEYFYTSGGHANGGALAYTQARFALCIIKCGSSNWPHAETRVYWNGTAITGGGSTVTYP